MPPMNAPSPPTRALASHAPLSVGQFVAFIAALMALNALAVDIMLPALPAIGADLGMAVENDRQMVITAYLLGFGLGQFFMGPLSDRFGRRPVLIAGLLAYAAAAALCASVSGASALLAARFAQGIGSAAPRVIVTALVRDCYEGRTMARVTSYAMMVFMVAPVIAPSIGQAVLLAGPWRWIFAVLALYAAAVLWVAATRLPETLPPQRRRALSRAGLAGSARLVLGSRQTVGYALAAGVFFGALFGFIGSAQQILAELYGLGAWFPIAFAGVAVAIALASLVNALMVERLGMRALSHGAVIAFTAISATLAALSLAGPPPLWLFMALLGAAMMLVGLTFANFNALAMAPMAEAAGIASSLIGGATTVIGASLGFVIARAYDGTITPLAVGYTLCGAGCLGLLLVTERGRLMRGGV